MKWWNATKHWLAQLAILALAIASSTVAVSANTQTGLSVTTRADRDSVYSNEQILVTVRVEADRNAFSLTGDQLIVQNAQVLSLNKTSHQGMRNGRPTVITERRYAVFSTQVGRLEIPALAFQAQLPVSANTDGPKTNPKLRANSRALSVDILEPPASVNTWFPATSVALQSDWGEGGSQPPTLVPGEPVDINLRIKVTGQHPAAIPPLQIDTSSNLRSYPAAAAWETYQSKLGFGGILTQRVTLVASDSKPAYIKQLAVPWWDINAGQWRTARLARQPLVVTGHKTRWYVANKMVLIAIAAVLLTGVALLMISKFTLFRHHPHNEKSAWRALKRAVRNQHAHDTRTALLGWSRLRWPGERISGATSAETLNPSLATIFQRLENDLYAPESAANLRELDWDKISRTLAQVRSATKNERPNAVQASLYPSSQP